MAGRDLRPVGNSQEDMESAKGVKRCTHLATERDVDVHMKFLCTFPDGAAIWLPQAGFFISKSMKGGI